jgi:hypothetical protein
MNRIRHIIITGAIALLGIFSLVPLAQTAGAIDVFTGACDGNTGGGTTGGTGTTGGGAQKICGATKTDDAQNILKNVINTLLVVLGMIAVIMIVIGGIRYTTSNGDANQTKSAKDTIMYAVIGLVVAIFAFAIVNFVLNAFIK